MSTARSCSPKHAPQPTILEEVVANEHPPRWCSVWNTTRSEFDLLLFSVALKLLLFPSYRSTDFEVHRNWLAITHALPVSKWYYDTTSEWTLDYPPFFAYFEKVLSIPAAYIDPAIVDLHNLGYGSWTVVAYQRSTVILTELLLGAVLLRFIKRSVDPPLQRLLSGSLFFHPGFLIVDHIHFQYNGFLFAILLWSILMARAGRNLYSGVLFAVLLNFKHIYMYLAPAYFVYLLRSYCMSKSGQLLTGRFATLASAVVLVFLISLGPFIWMGQLPQLLSRLFPFTRGLNHAYWAPNAWALVTAGDRIMLRLITLFNLGIAINEQGIASASRGLVGDTVFAVFPHIKPFHTFLITACAQMVYMIKLWRTPTYRSFLNALTLCGFTSFMFGWHVHEKAILLVLVPLSLLAADNYAYFKTWMIASTAGIFSLFPLLFTSAEMPIKIVYCLVWGATTIYPLRKRVYEFPPWWPLALLDQLEYAYVVGFVPLQFFFMVFPIVAGKSSDIQFLPLMVTSVYCAAGLVWAFIRLSVLYFGNAFGTTPK
ncbi:glycosyltransferase family 57 protein [Pisolithus croceorrhizus]|nr:glycosyltransferase family 57 protein [Pisolithus croceorrhizus]